MEICRQWSQFVQVVYRWQLSYYNMFIWIQFPYGNYLGRLYSRVKAYRLNRLQFLNRWRIRYCTWCESRDAYVRLWFPRCKSHMSTFCLWSSLRHCHFPLALSSISISSLNDVIAVAGANRSICGLMTALTVNVAVLYFKSYSWCNTNNCSHSTSGCCREHVSACFDYWGGQ